MPNEKEIAHYINEAKKKDFIHFTNKNETIRFALSCIDLTTLEGSDTDIRIMDLCNKALSYVPQTAAVCVFPIFVRQAKAILAGSGVKVATVAGGFPAGQIPLSCKMEEVQYALSEGADEIDTIISRGKFLEGKHDVIFDEIKAIKSVCKDVPLKVILETGELKTVENITQASQIAIAAGADFIKTSTGKIAISATPEAFTTMLLVIKSHYEQTGIQIGIKVAGGIRDTETTLLYIKLLEQTLGERWLNSTCFRIGASSLADQLAKK